MSAVTPRQMAFLTTLALLCKSAGHPVHYSAVASHLHVSPFSAYDMLKVLQDKGYASAEYTLDVESPGPGRSQIVFSPTAGGWACVLSLSGAEGDSGSLRPAMGEDWQEIRERILERLRRAGQSSYRDLLQDVLARLPERHSPMAYCADMATALLLNLDRVRSKVIGVNPFDALVQLTAQGDVGLGALAGLSLGSALAYAEDRTDRSQVEALYAGVQRYQRLLASLNQESKQRLSEFLQDAICIVASHHAAQR